VIADALVAAFDDPLGCACVYVDGELVAEARGERWPDRGIVHVASVTKPAAAFCVHLLADRGAIDLDRAVAEYWPEFGVAGKDRVTVAQALAHQAGVLAFREPQPLTALTDWHRAAELVAHMEPWWPPGTAHGEHALLYGHIAGELVRRVDGRSLGRFWREQVAEPWSLDFAIGLTDDELARAVDVGADPGWRERTLEGRGEVYRLALDNPPALLYPDIVNSREWRTAEIPAVNGHADARAVARFYAGLLAGGELDGVRLCSEQTVSAATAPRMTGPDVLLGVESTWSAGFGLDVDGFGMGGLGGSLGWADPDKRLAFGYVTAALGSHERAEAVYTAASASL
jgi:CubicO group peptidase (beta-lactamase class C family)